MAIMRIKNRLSASSPAPPPPSPIPTAKGSRSAANSAFSTYLDKSKLVPELNLPDYINRSVIADIDYALLKSRDAEAVGSIIKLATEFGVFRISNHGIPAEELRLSALGDEGEACFGLLTECCRRYYDREEFLWRRSAVEAAVERGKEAVGVHKYRDFSKKIENVAAKLEEMAEEVAQIIASNRRKQPSKNFHLNESKLTLCRHNNYSLTDQYSPSSFENRKDYYYCKYALRLHFPLDHGEFCINSDGGPSSFNASSDTIVVTVGELLEEWSQGEFKSAYGELNFEPDLQGGQPSFSIELKYCCPSDFNHALDKNDKRISIANQLFLVLIITLMYKMFTAVIFS